jgi:hypothetical protein
MAADRLKIGKKTLKKAGAFLAAGFLYTAFATFLFWPDSKIGYIFIFSTTSAAIGVFLLSRRWIADYIGSFFAGAFYGFGPLFLSLGSFHWSVSVLAAIIPWLFLPAVFAPAAKNQKLHILRIASVFLPFFAIIIFFQLTLHFRLFAAPIRAELIPADLTAFLWPLAAAEQGFNPVGLYHIANALAFIGFFMMIKARRYKVLAVLLAGIILAFCPPIFEVSPIIWFAIATLGLAILAGEGFGGLVLAGLSDRRWVLSAGFLSILFSFTAFFFSIHHDAIVPEEYSPLFAYSGRFHLLSALVCLVIFFMIKSGIRILTVRRLLISAALAVDICFAARFLLTV